MTTGLEIINDFGGYQITEKYANLLLRSVNTITVPANARIPSFQYNYAGSEKSMVAIFSEIVFVAPYGSGATLTRGVMQMSIVNPTSSIQTFKFVVFDTADTITSPGVGLEVWDADGNKVFVTAPPLKLTFNVMPTSGKVGFYPIYYYSYGDEGRGGGVIFIQAVRVVNSQVQRADVPTTGSVSAGSFDWGPPDKLTQIGFVDLGDIL